MRRTPSGEELVDKVVWRRRRRIVIVGVCILTCLSLVTVVVGVGVIVAMLLLGGVVLGVVLMISRGNVCRGGGGL